METARQAIPSLKAVVCGINEYGSAQNNLPSCVNDARAIARLLQEQYGCRDVHIVLDREATVANIEKELEWLVADALPGDRRVFYFSGHGFTKMVGEVMREFLVLLDDTGKPALWEDDKLVEITRKTPAGCDPTVVLDSCYSGGMFKWIFDPTESVAEAAKIKVYQPPLEEQQKDFALSDVSAESAVRRRVTGYRQFGRSSNASAAAVGKAFGIDSSSSWTTPTVASKAVSDESESGQPELKGLLISACLETETAAASTSRTNGLSAFTFALLQVMADGAKGESAREVFDRTAAKLATLGFRQTPTCVSSESGNLAHHSFITMEDTTMTATTAQPIGAPASADAEQEVQKRVLEGILTMLPTLMNIVGAQRKAAEFDEEESALGESGNGDEVIDKGAFDLIRTLFPVALQIAQSARRKDVEIDAQAQGSSDPTSEDMQKFLPALMAIATIAPKIPGAVNAVRNLVSPPRHSAARQRTKSAGLDASDAETQKSLQSVLSMVLAAAPHVARALKPQSRH